jgi:SAM-dependent methyltransferase
MKASPSSAERFSDRVEDYVRFRPRYPFGLVALLQREIGLQASWHIADVGSGTGFSAEPFLKHGNPVTGIEPNPHMRAAAERLLARWPGFSSVAGTAEATGMPDCSVDLVVAGQAFHWFDAARARREFRRILRPPGWTVLLWNRRLLDETRFLRAYEDLLATFGTDYQAVRHDRLGQDDIDDFFEAHATRYAMPYVQHFDFEGLKGRLLSSSYAPAANHAMHGPMIQALRRIFEEHQRDGIVSFEFETQIHAGRLMEG